MNAFAVDAVEKFENEVIERLPCVGFDQWRGIDNKYSHRAQFQLLSVVANCMRSGEAAIFFSSKLHHVVQSLNSPFFPPHLGAEPGRAKREDNLHAHAQNESIKNYQVPTTLLASMCRAMPFSARALKENIFFDVDIIIKNIKT